MDTCRRMPCPVLAEAYRLGCANYTTKGIVHSVRSHCWCRDNVNGPFQVAKNASIQRFLCLPRSIPGENSHCTAYDSRSGRLTRPLRMSQALCFASYFTVLLVNPLRDPDLPPVIEAWSSFPPTGQNSKSTYPCIVAETSCLTLETTLP